MVARTGSPLLRRYMALVWCTRHLLCAVHKNIINGGFTVSVYVCWECRVDKQVAGKTECYLVDVNDVCWSPMEGMHLCIYMCSCACS